MRTPYIPKPKPDFPSRPFSWSQMSSFAFSKSSWYDKYCVHGECKRNICIYKEEDCPVSRTSPEMLFGNVCGGLLASDPSYLPEVERAAIFEHELRSTVGDIELLGFLDSFCSEKKILLEYKTSRDKKKWTYKSASLHRQLDFYAFLIYQNYKIKPEELTIKLVYIPCHIQEGAMALSGEAPKTFNVKKTLGEVLSFANEIKTRRAEMEAFYHLQ